MMKKGRLRKLVGVMGVGMVITLCGCGDRKEEGNLTAIQPMESSIAETVSSQIVLTYPEHMKENGYTESLVLDGVPQRVVSLTTYPLQALFEMGVMPIALPSTKVMEYPADFKGEILPGVMSEEFDVEKIVSMEPDLVFMPETVKDSYGTALEQLDIPVYYVAMNAENRTSYEVIKEQTQAIVSAFSIDEEKKMQADEIMNRFSALENKIAEFAKKTQGKSVFAITVSGTSVYINGDNNTLGSMLAMLGYENVYDTTTGGGHGMNELDMEVAIEYEPDIMVITGSSTLEDNKAMMDAIYETNKEYWDSISAYKEGRVIYLPSSYVSTAGMNILDNIENLMSDLEGLN